MTFAAGGWLVAQASGLDPSLANLIGNGITVAVLVWYVVYDVRVRHPSMLGTFSKEQDELRRAFKDEQAGSRETFKAEQTEVRRSFTAAIDALLKDNRDDRARMREAHAAEIDHWRKMVADNISAMRGAVHDTRDLAQTVITKSELGQKKGEPPC